MEWEELENEEKLAEKERLKKREKINRRKPLKIKACKKKTTSKHKYSKLKIVILYGDHIHAHQRSLFAVWFWIPQKINPGTRVIPRTCSVVPWCLQKPSTCYGYLRATDM